MRGISKFNTKEDVYNNLSVYREDTIRALKQLYNDRVIWETITELISLDEGINDETHRAFATKDMNDEKEIFVQQELVVDKNAAIYKLGFSDEEILEIIGD